MTSSAGVAMEMLLIVLSACITGWLIPTVTVAATEAPHIQDQPKINETAYKANEDVRLPCVAEGNPEYIWKKDDVELDTGSGQWRYIIQPPGGTIVIKAPTGEDDGVYQCFAHNEFGTAVTIKTRVQKAEIHPFATVHDPQIHRPIVGHSQTLRCQPPHSYPAGSVYWGNSQPHSTTLEAIQTDDRVLLDYNGNLHFANVLQTDSLLSLGDDVRYVCIINNPLLGAFLQGDDQKLRPSDYQDAPSYIAPSAMWSSPSPAIAIKGGTKRMKCIFGGLPTPRVEWSRADGKPWNNRFRVTPEGHGTELEITNVEVEDEGVYRCRATNSQDHPAASVEIHLLVHSRPVWRQNNPPSDQLVNEEDDVVFVCNADGNPPPRIAWFINGLPIEPQYNPRRRVEGNRVTYRRVLSAEDNAVLQCAATNDHGSILANAVLKINAAPPSFTSAPEDQKVVEGRGVTFTCRVYGAPQPQLAWKHDTTAVSGNRFVLHASGDLEITAAQLSDNGTYHCEASNKFGRDSASAFLTVRAPTRITGGPLSQTVNVGDEVTLRCDADTDPSEPLTVEWRRDGQPIDFTTELHLRFNDDNNSLVILTARVADTAQYTCHAGNGLDEVESPPATVTVRDRPSPPWPDRVDCQSVESTLFWYAGDNNNAPISKFVVYYRDWSPDAARSPPFNRSALTIGANMSVSAGGEQDYEEEFFANVRVLPWRHYQFYVSAVNQLGESDLSEPASAAECITPPWRPKRNPRGVCSSLRASRQLVIVWQPLSEEELCGRGFYYEVSYKLRGSAGPPQTTHVYDFTTGEVIIDNRETFRQYEISVQSFNDLGPSTQDVLPRIGYSGEGKPLDPPENFRLLGEPYNGTFAEFAWDSVDTSPERVQGFFRGYRILMWRSSDPNEQRTEDVILHDDFDRCPPISVQRRRRHGDRRPRTAGQPEFATTNQLWPFSRISATVATLNSANVGFQSDPIEISTPEGIAGVVGSLAITERGSYHLVAEWTPPSEPNGIILNYIVTCRVAPPNVGDPEVMTVAVVGPLSKMIRQLHPKTMYRISVMAANKAGAGNEIYVDQRTLPAASPDKPLIDSITVGEGSAASVHFLSYVHRPPINPGTDFYVEYTEEEHADQAQWNETQPIVGVGLINVTGLQHGHRYSFRVVAMNGVPDSVGKTRSDPHTVIMAEGVVTFATPIYYVAPVEVEDDDDEAAYLAHASTGWFIILMIIIAILLLILLIACIVFRSRGDVYPVYEKEKLRGRDPLAPDDTPFGEYTAGGRPDLSRSQGSLDSEEKPLESSESDSLGEYEDPEASKFNEDGSFIGLYGAQENRPPAAPQSSPTSYNTFV